MLQIILPGSHLEQTPVRIGPGLQQCGDQIAATKAGELIYSDKDAFVSCTQKRYIPVNNDIVIGQIVARHSEGYKVDIGSAVAAQLDHLAFEGATRKNKPNLQVGHLVYARISFANKFTEPEIVCFHASTGKSAGFGLLEGGNMITVSLGIARFLLRPECELLLLLSHHFKYEVAIGMNGRIWINAESIKAVVAVARCIESINDSKITDISGLVRRIVRQVAE